MENLPLWCHEVRRVLEATPDSFATLGLGPEERGRVRSDDAADAGRPLAGVRSSGLSQA